MVVWYFALDGLLEESHKYRINKMVDKFGKL